MHHAPRTLGARYGSLYRPSLQKPQTAVYKSHDTWHCRQQHGPRATAAVPNTSSSNTGSISTAGTSSSGASPIVSSSTGLTTDWEARRKQRVVRDLVEASKRLGPQYTLEAIAAGVTTLEQLLPGLQIDVEAMKASQWAKLCLDVNAAAMRLVVLKTEYPKADLTKIMQKQPQLLLTNIPTLQDNAKQVKQLLSCARDPDALLTVLPSLLDPKTLISVLVTVKKWYFNKRDPVEVLEADPELLMRAQECDIPFEPVYVEDSSGAWTAPSLNYHEKRTEWQAYIDQKVYKQE
eukprot:GHRR01016716.1.p1 GENE.GHRR01016716.1~~GHRR01016716.1.p1  ORF type:complete len:291 (+),score=105.78 GHRR01016716.1:283-1155(+)